MEIKAVAEPGGLAPHHSNKPGLGLRNPGIGTGKGLTGAVSTVSRSLIKLGTQFVLFCPDERTNGTAHFEAPTIAQTHSASLRLLRE